MTTSPPAAKESPTQSDHPPAHEFAGSFPRFEQLRHLSLALVTVLSVVGILIAIVPPRWESNDDVGMSMIVHGYGLATRGSPNLMFSNILWGKLILALPQVGNMLGYSLASLAALLLAACGILYFLLRLEVSYSAAALTLALLLARPTLLPQFTINAGLLAVAATLGWQVYARIRNTAALVISLALAFLSYLIRSQEFFLVIAVATPFVPWRALAKDLRIKSGFFLLLCAILLAARLDMLAYSGSEWSSYRELNAARAPYTDFHAGEFVKQKPEVMARYGYSKNDIDLIDDWFFADPTIAEPHSLTGMLRDSGWLQTRVTNVVGGLRAMKSPFLPGLMPLTALAILVFILKPDRKLLLSGILYLCAVFALGVAGRPAPTRVGFALSALLIAQGLVCGRLRRNVEPSVVLLACSLVCVLNVCVLMPQVMEQHRVDVQIQKDIRNLPSESFIAWGSDFPFESAYTPFGSDTDLYRLRIYPLGVFTKVPYSVAMAEEKAGFGLVKRLRSHNGLPMVASPGSMRLLRTYCAEHWRRELRYIATVPNPSFTMLTAWCD